MNRLGGEGLLALWGRWAAAIADDNGRLALGVGACVRACRRALACCHALAGRLQGALVPHRYGDDVTHLP